MRLFLRLGNCSCITLPTHIHVLVEDKQKSCVKLSYIIESSLLIRDEQDYENHVNYIHYNPVKHQYVDHAVDWPYSTIHAYISNGVLSNDWGDGADSIPEIEFGERL